MMRKCESYERGRQHDDPRSGENLCSRRYSTFTISFVGPVRVIREQGLTNRQTGELLRLIWNAVSTRMLSQNDTQNLPPS